MRECQTGLPMIIVHLPQKCKVTILPFLLPLVIDWVVITTPNEKRIVSLGMQPGGISKKNFVKNITLVTPVKKLIKN